MDIAETSATLGTRHRTNTKETKNTTHKQIKKTSNTGLTEEMGDKPVCFKG